MIDKDKSADIFLEEFGEDVVDMLGYNPLPMSLKVSLEKDNFDLNKVPGIYVICWHAKEVKMLQAKANKAVLKKIRGFLPMLHLNQML